MMGRFCSAAVILLIAGIAAAEAAPLVPSGCPAASATASRRRRSTASCSRPRRPNRSYAGGAVSAPTHRTDRSATAAVEVGEGLLGVITPPALFFAHPAAPPPRRAP